MSRREEFERGSSEHRSEFLKVGLPSEQQVGEENPQFAGKSPQVERMIGPSELPTSVFSDYHKQGFTHMVRLNVHEGGPFGSPEHKGFASADYAYHPERGWKKQGEGASGKFLQHMSNFGLK